jgi:uncharacterized Zn-finger protein
MARTKNAVLVAAAIEVTCPHCGEPQPAPDNGSEMWLPSQVTRSQGERTCVSCDEKFVLHAQSRVGVPT